MVGCINLDLRIGREMGLNLQRGDCHLREMGGLCVMILLFEQYCDVVMLCWIFGWVRYWCRDKRV